MYNFPRGNNAGIECKRRLWLQCFSAFQNFKQGVKYNETTETQVVVGSPIYNYNTPSPLMGNPSRRIKCTWPRDLTRHLINKTTSSNHNS